MITAEFYLRNETFAGFAVKGHAGYADFGLDVVCAAVTSAVELTANGITEILKVNATVGSFENEVRLMLPDSENPEAVQFLQALRLHLELLAEDYPENLQLIDMEV